METPYRRERSAGYMTNWTARLYARALERRLPNGGGSGSMPVFFALLEKDGRSQRDLARWAAVEQPTMANTLNRMERDGLIARTPDPGDGRSALVSLTRSGRQTALQAMSVAAEVNVLGMSALKPAERDTYLDMLRRIADVLSADSE
jgi:DNA-binding MarR family transcriptional regulator